MNMKQFKKERKEKLKNNAKSKAHLFFCQRCGNNFTETVPASEGWQPFSLYPCKNCGSEFASFIKYGNVGGI